MRTTFISLAQSVIAALHTCAAAVQGIISFHKNIFPGTLEDPAHATPSVQDYFHLYQVVNTHHPQLTTHYYSQPLIQIIL